MKTLPILVSLCFLIGVTGYCLAGGSSLVSSLEELRGEGNAQADARLLEAIKKLDPNGVRNALAGGANPNCISDTPRKFSAIGECILSSFFSATQLESEIREKRCIEMLNLLFQAGAKLQPYDKEVLFFPISDGFTSVVELLLKKGASPTAKFSGGMTPVELAEQDGHKEIVDILVQYGALPISQKEAAQLRFIRFAREHDIIGMGKAIRDGADVDGTNSRGERALPAAVGWVSPKSELEWYASIVYLLQKGANPNSQGKERTALHNAMFTSHLLFMRYTDGNDIYGVLVVDALVKAGAHVSSSDKNNRTPLHIAAKWNNIRGVDMLIRAGAKIMPRDKEGKTPLDYAESAEMIKLLKSHGAKEQ